jgi:Protein of unknown function, DUF488
MRIWTSQFQHKVLAQHPELVKVGITVWPPRFKLGYAYERLPMLTPYGGLFHESDRERFTRAYYARLDTAGVETVLHALRAISERHGGRDLVLLCYEDLSKPDEWCHRQIAAQWLQERAGLTVAEWSEPCAS